MDVNGCKRSGLIGGDYELWFRELVRLNGQVIKHYNSIVVIVNLSPVKITDVSLYIGGISSFLGVNIPIAVILNCDIFGV